MLEGLVNMCLKLVSYRIIDLSSLQNMATIMCLYVNVYLSCYFHANLLHHPFMMQCGWVVSMQTLAFTIYDDLCATSVLVRALSPCSEGAQNSKSARRGVAYNVVAEATTVAPGCTKLPRAPGPVGPILRRCFSFPNFFSFF